jgi:hypothetical protein
LGFLAALKAWGCVLIRLGTKSPVPIGGA